MKACTFFGNRDTPNEAETLLKEAILHLIEQHGVNRFYVGTHGNFDRMVYRQLSEMEKTHGIRFFVVLAYYPNRIQDYAQDAHTIFFEGMETVPPRFAIVKRNRWMLEQCEYVISYVRDKTGSAARFKFLAEKKGKTVVELFSSPRPKQ